MDNRTSGGRIFMRGRCSGVTAPASPGGVSAQSRDREAGGGLGFGARQLFEPLPDPGEGGVGGSFVVEGAEVDDLDAR